MPYDLGRSTAPWAIHWGSNDWVATPTDVRWLARQLPNVARVRSVPQSGFNHLDFLWAKDARSLVYLDVIRTVRRFNPRPSRPKRYVVEGEVA